jgi:hypothetical protein
MRHRLSEMEQRVTGIANGPRWQGDIDHRTRTKLRWMLICAANSGVAHTRMEARRLTG